MSFGLYLLGYVIFTIGLIYGAYLLYVPQTWIAAAALCVLGIGIAHGATATRQKDPVESPRR